MKEEYLPMGFDDLKNNWIELLKNNKNEEAEIFYFEKLMPTIIPLVKARLKSIPKYDGMISLLGFTPETVVLAYQTIYPKKLVVLYTPESEKNLDKVLKYSKVKVSSFFHELFQHDEVHINDIYLALKQAIRKFKKNDRILIELTGGKKTMGSQLAIAAGVLEQKSDIKFDVCYIDYGKYISEIRKPEPETTKFLLIKNPLSAPYQIFGNIEEKDLNTREIIVNPIFNARRFNIQSNLAFAIMPFSEEWSDSLWKDIIKPSCEDLGLNALRADHLQGKEIMEDIWKGINEAKIVIADITNRNPNVLYELGIAHTLGKDVILLTQEIKDTPFDLNKYRFIIYEDSIKGFSKLSKKLKLMLKDTI